MGMVGGLMALNTGANAIGTATSTYSQAKAIKTQSKYEQQQANFNAEVADLQAQEAINRGNREASLKRKETKRLIGDQRAALAAQGIDVNTDTAAIIQQDTAGVGAEDVETIKNNAWKEAWGYQVQSQEYRSQAEFARISGKYKRSQTIATGGLQFARDISGGALDFAKNGKTYQDAWDNRKK